MIKRWLQQYNRETLPSRFESTSTAKQVESHEPGFRRERNAKVAVAELVFLNFEIL